MLYEEEEEPKGAVELGLLEGFVVPKEEAPEGIDEPVSLVGGAVEEGVDEPPYPPVVEPVALEPVALELGELEPVAPDPVVPEPPVVAEGGVAEPEDVAGVGDLEAGFEHAPKARAETMTKGRASNLSFIFLSLKDR